MTQEKKQEFTLKISQANKTQLITILYEMVIEYISDAMDDFSVGSRESADKNINLAQSCIDELIMSLKMEYDLAKSLRNIYIFSKKELTAAAGGCNMHRMWRVKQNFKKLWEAYKVLEKEDESQPLMGNIQTVYAGLTYGKYRLNEDVTAVSMNRGYMA